jgi:hypothetical protein
MQVNRLDFGLFLHLVGAVDEEQVVVNVEAVVGGEAFDGEALEMLR